MSASARTEPAAGRSAQELRRVTTGYIGWVLCGVALLCVIGPLVDIVGTVAYNGVAAFSLKLFTSNTTGANSGIKNAIEGTVLITVFAMCFAVPVGVGAGIYLSEYGNNKLGSTIRFLSDVLTGTPSIVLGYFSYIVFVIAFGWGFSILAAAITIAACITVIIVST